MKSWIEIAEDTKRAHEWFSHYIRYILSEYKNLTVRYINYDKRGCCFVCDMDNKSAVIVVSNYIVNEVLRREYYSNENINVYKQCFETNVKLKVLEAFYATKIYD